MRGGTLEEKLQRRTERMGNGCLIWLGSWNSRSYGNIWDADRGRVRSVHRVAYETWVGPIPDGLEIDHLCRNRPCVEPTHLEAVGHRTNVFRGEGLAVINTAKTHCPSGHEYTEDNLFPCDRRRAAPIRRCRTCHRERARARRAP